MLVGSKTEKTGSSNTLQQKDEVHLMGIQNLLPNIRELMVVAPPVLVALSFHEYAHGYIAYRFGDDTAKQSGRLTLNPLAHLDPLGTIMLFLVHFGWAKPVPVNPNRLKNPKRDMLWIED